MVFFRRLLVAGAAVTTVRTSPVLHQINVAYRGVLVARGNGGEILS